MRIISGKYNRRVLRPPSNLPIRPTTDRAKESLFNILNNRLEMNGKSALDLFSGSGSVALEFVSRGCTNVLSVDNNQRCVSWIREIAKTLNANELTVLRSDVFRFMEQTFTPFDIIFADPPYSLEGIETISRMVFKNNLLNANGWLVVEHPKHIDFSDQLHFVEHRKYGKVNFSFFKNEKN